MKFSSIILLTLSASTVECAKERTLDDALMGLTNLMKMHEEKDVQDPNANTDQEKIQLGSGSKINAKMINKIFASLDWPEGNKADDVEDA